MCILQTIKVLNFAKLEDNHIFDVFGSKIFFFSINVNLKVQNSKLKSMYPIIKSEAFLLVPKVFTSACREQSDRFAVFSCFLSC